MLPTFACSMADHNTYGHLGGQVLISRLLGRWEPVSDIDGTTSYGNPGCEPASNPVREAGATAFKSSAALQRSPAKSIVDVDGTGEPRRSVVLISVDALRGAVFVRR
jgi:hypothetical protein